MNGAIRSRQLALKSIFRALSGAVALVVILATSGCVGVTGKGTTPTVPGVAIEISPSSLSFGNVAVGQSTTKTVTLTNTGTEALSVSGISVAGTGFTASGPHLPISLPAGQSTSISAVFKPTVEKADTGTITITSNAASSPSLVALSGTGTTGTTPTTPAALTATPNTITFGSVAVGSEATQTIHLENTGGEAAAISKLTISGAGVSVSGIAAPMTLAAGQTANLTVTYKPTAAGTLAGSVSIASNASDPSISIGVSATATISTLSATPASVTFGNVVVGSDTTQTIRLQNIGTSQVTISSITSSVSSIAISGVTLPVKLAPGTSATLTAAYKPTAAGSVTGKITVTSNAVGSPTIVALSGTGTTATAAAALTATPNSIAFGSVAVGSEATQTIHLENTGGEAAAISKLTISGAGVSVSGIAAPMTLAAGQTANLTVTYKPTAAGTLAGSVSIASNASDPSISIGVSATATISTLSATPASVTFGNVVVGSDTTQTIRLQNIGTSHVTISSITPSVSSIAISGVTTPVTLAPGTSATLTAAYKPTAAGSVTGKITVTSNAVGSPTIVDLSATAAAATVQLTPSATSLSFGSVTVGSSGSHQVTVKSTGNTKASISKVTVTGTGFVLGTSAANVILDPSQSQPYTVNFDPKAAGSLTGTLTITSNAKNSPLNIPLSGTAVAAASEHTVALTWERSTSSVTGYFVYRGTKPSGPFTQLNSTPDASPTFSDSTVASGQVYYYFVTAVDSSNIQSADSNEVSVTIPAN